MSVSMNNLFNYARSLPEPFDKLANKKVKISSKYGSGTEATLCATVIKAVHAVCNCMNGTGEGAMPEVPESGHGENVCITSKRTNFRFTSL